MLTAPSSWLEIVDTAPTIEQRCERLVEAILPDLNRPFRVVLADNVRDRLALRPGTSLAGDCLDLAFRDYLQQRGRWPGRCNVVLIDRPNFAEIVAVTIHEAAHTAEQIIERHTRPPVDESNITPETREKFYGWFADAKVSKPSPSSALPPWHQHELTWIRLALHLAHCARLLGLRLHLETVGIAGHRYGLSPVADYERALLPELFDVDHEQPLTTIVATEPPAEFTELFLQDTNAAN